MRWQVLASIAAVALSTVAPASATVIDFSSDPNLANEWTRYDFYGQSEAGFTQAWNETNQSLDLASAGTSANVGFFKNGTSRADGAGVTLTLSNIVQSPDDWLNAGLIVSQQRSPVLFDNTPFYALAYGRDTSNAYLGVTKSSSNGIESLARVDLTSAPASVKLDITRDGAYYVFLANGDEICRDSSLSATSLPNYMMYWGSGAGASMSVSADNFGVVPEPQTIVLALTAFLGLICYAWRIHK